MVYCSKCGTQNSDDSKNCSNCGAPLYTVGEPYRGSEREHYRRVESECFGLPHGGAIAALVFGAIIVIAGIGMFLQANSIVKNFEIWPIIVIIFGVLLLAGALYRRRRLQS